MTLDQLLVLLTSIRQRNLAPGEAEVRIVTTPYRSIPIADAFGYDAESNKLFLGGSPGS